VFPVRCSNVSYAHTHHDYPADDIFAATGCVVVSPVSGVVEYVTTVDTWNPATNYGYARGGLSFAVVGSDGVRYYGSHLSVLLPGIRVGVHVTAGQQVGNVGRTGDAAQPGISSHLHFGISWPTPPTGATGGYWWVRRGEVWPWPYLDAWRAGIQKSPAAEVAARRASVGATPSCSVDC
jgi:murein DD-endopeptidase MepM/ murein hydrolase activator NlpD